MGYCGSFTGSTENMGSLSERASTLAYTCRPPVLAYARRRFYAYAAGCTGQAHSPHTALCLRCPFQKSEIATSSPPKGDIRLSGNGPNHPASAAIQTANPSEATAQTARRP